MSHRSYPAYVAGQPTGACAARRAPPPRARPPGRETYLSAGRPGPEEWDYLSESPADDAYVLEDETALRAARRNGRATRVDVKELLKKEAFYAESEACDDHFEKNRPCPSGVYGVSDQYVVLDTFNKVESVSNPAQGTFAWNFMVQGVTGNQVVGVKDVIDTVIEIQVGDFCVPLPLDLAYFTNAWPSPSPGLPVLTPNPGPPFAAGVCGPLSQLPFCGRFTVEMKEIGLQSISDPGGARHHFEFSAAPGPTGHGLVAVPLKGFETYVFTDPIKDVQGLTLVFRNPDQPVSFPQDCFDGVRAVVGPGQMLQFEAPGNNLAAADRVYLRGFASASPTINHWVNRAQGQLVGGGGLAPGQSFRLDPDVSVASLGLLAGDEIPTSGSATLCIAKNRMRIPMRLRRVVARLTNYIAP